MELSMATDYASDNGNPEPYLRRIAEAGFTHIQWIHHWRHDFIYTQPEVAYVASLMAELGLSIYDIHAPAGAEKNWFSSIEYQRLAGVEIIKNRVDMCRTLGGRVVVAHIPERIVAPDSKWAQVRTSLDELQEFCLEREVRIAVENRPNDEFTGINELFAEYPAEYLGLCYDSGHGNIGGRGLNHLAEVSGRLISCHLHDNDGLADQHRPVFTGTVDWDRLAQIIAASPYDEYLTIETDMKFSGFDDEDEFLASARRDGQRLLAQLRTVA